MAHLAVIRVRISVERVDADARPTLLEALCKGAAENFLPEDAADVVKDEYAPGEFLDDPINDREGVFGAGAG